MKLVFDQSHFAVQITQFQTKYNMHHKPRFPTKKKKIDEVWKTYSR